MSIDWEGIRERVRKLLELSEDAPLKPLATAVLKHYRNSRRFREVMELIEGEELKSVESARYPSELPELLKEVRKCGYKLALVTLRSWRTAEPLLTKLGVRDLFDVVVTRDEVPERSSQLVRVLECLGVSREETLFVGDWVGDEEAGRAVGIKTVIVRGPEEVVELLGSLLRACKEGLNKG
ncbi:MAG: HAD family hydrolase [Desulfurococcales archaeon]|nr:HAD family hydrolase [Desulfurococcales archaeon]